MLRGLVICVVVSTIALFANDGETAGADGPPAPHPRAAIAEGVYQGVLSWPNGAYGFSSGETDLAGNWALDGAVSELTIEGSTVRGDWSFEMSAGGQGTSSHDRSGLAGARNSASGGFEGNPGRLCMTGEMAVTGSLVVNDEFGSMDIPIDETLPLSCDLLGLTIAAASCTTVSGEWAVPLADTVTASGASFPTTGTFSLWRIGDAIGTPTENADVDALLVEMERVVNSDPFDGPAMGRVLRLIAEFEGNAARNIACGSRNPENTRIAGVFLYRLLSQRFLSGQPIDLSTLRWMAYAALNTGQIGAAAPQPDRATYLENEFQRVLRGLLDTAIGARDAEQIARVEVFADQYGFEQLSALAADAYEQIQGRG